VIVDDILIEMAKDGVVRTVLLVLLLGISIFLITRVVQLGRREKLREPAEKAILQNIEHLWAAKQVRAEQDERMLTLMSELLGHVEAALGRTHLSQSSRDLLDTIKVDKR
jgi:hypothetical protein